MKQQQINKKQTNKQKKNIPTTPQKKEKMETKNNQIEWQKHNKQRERKNYKKSPYNESNNFIKEKNPK